MNRKAFALLAMIAVMGGCARQTCAGVETVRIKVDGVGYDIPARLQPTQSAYPKDREVRTDYAYEGNRGHHIYCQESADPPADLDGVLFDGALISAFVAGKPDLAEAAGIGLVFLERRPAGTALDTESAKAGLTFFGKPVAARCRPLDGGGEGCRFSGRTPDGLRVVFDLDSRTVPQARWQAVISGLESFERSLRHKP